MYREGGYIQVVEDCAKQSMAAVAQGVKALQGMARYKFCCIYNVITSSIDFFFSVGDY